MTAGQSPRLTQEVIVTKAKTEKVSRAEVRSWPSTALTAARCLVGGKVIGEAIMAWRWIHGEIPTEVFDADAVEVYSASRTDGRWVRVTADAELKLTPAESAALALIGCPAGGWPETQQAQRQFRDLAGRYRDGVWVSADAIETARYALKRGADRPARAAEWGL